MNRKEFLKNKNDIEKNISKYMNEKFNCFTNKNYYSDLKIKKAKIYKNIAIVDYKGATYEGYKLINLKTLKVIEGKTKYKEIYDKNIYGENQKYICTVFTDSYNNLLHMLTKCKKSNDDIKIYKFN